MKKEQFLITQYERMMSTGDFVVEQWRSSRDRFMTDMWDRTPIYANHRRLEPIDPELGFSPDNVEWQFRKIRPKITNTKKTAKPALLESRVREVARRPTKDERKQIELAAKEAKRRAIAEEYARWEEARGKTGRG